MSLTFHLHPYSAILMMFVKVDIMSCNFCYVNHPWISIWNGKIFQRAFGLSRCVMNSHFLQNHILECRGALREWLITPFSSRLCDRSGIVDSLRARPGAGLQTQMQRIKSKSGADLAWMSACVYTFSTGMKYMWKKNHTMTLLERTGMLQECKLNDNKASLMQ